MITALAIIITVLGVAGAVALPVVGVKKGKKMIKAILDKRKIRKYREQITFIVPFRTDHGRREKTWKWLEKYYRAYFPEAEFIVTSDASTPFCKTAAINRGGKKVHGDVIVIMDADCFIEPFVLREAARKIRDARNQGRKIWFMPYRRFYRLKEWYSDTILDSNPHSPPVLPDPPPPNAFDPLTPGSVSAGHWWGALIQVMPREAFELVGGMDERFCGWGGEDVSFMHALDTLYAKHKTLNYPVYHLWHPSIPGSWKGTRQWEGQADPEMNDWLSTRYEYALGDPKAMRRLVDEGHANSS